MLQLHVLNREHRHHSPDGFEIGHGGSGSADLALNVLADVLPRPKDDPGVRRWDGSPVATSK